MLGNKNLLLLRLAALLYLNNGKWNDTQILSENWVTETLKTQILQDDNSSANGYSYLFWLKRVK